MTLCGAFRWNKSYNELSPLLDHCNMCGWETLSSSTPHSQWPWNLGVVESVRGANLSLVSSPSGWRGWLAWEPEEG